MLGFKIQNTILQSCEFLLCFRFSIIGGNVPLMGRFFFVIVLLTSLNVHQNQVQLFFEVSKFVLL